VIDDEKKIRGLLESGAEIAGAVSGTSIGFLLAGPAGAIIGSGASPLITKMFKRSCLEFYDRVLSKRQRQRASAAISFAVVEIANRLESGELPRDDGFFDFDVSRCPAEEVLEGVVIKSQNEHEEKKAQYYAYLFSTAAFDRSLSLQELNQLLAVAQALTYSQLCLLRLFEDEPVFSLKNRAFGDLGSDDSHAKVKSVLLEIVDLHSRELVYCFRSNEDRSKYALLAVDYLNPATMRREFLGRRLTRAMKLEKIPLSDLKPIVDLLNSEIV
jgi:hypothetical protein